MNGKKARAIRRLAVPGGGNLRTELLGRRQYVVRGVKERTHKTDKLDSLGEPIFRNVKYIIVGLEVGSARAKYRALKAAT